MGVMLQVLGIFMALIGAFLESVVASLIHVSHLIFITPSICLKIVIISHKLNICKEEMWM